MLCLHRPKGIKILLKGAQRPWSREDNKRTVQDSLEYTYLFIFPMRRSMQLSDLSLKTHTLYNFFLFGLSVFWAHAEDISLARVLDSSHCIVCIKFGVVSKFIDLCCKV